MLRHCHLVVVLGLSLLLLLGADLSRAQTGSVSGGPSPGTEDLIRVRQLHPPISPSSPGRVRPGHRHDVFGEGAMLVGRKDGLRIRNVRPVGTPGLGEEWRPAPRSLVDGWARYAGGNVNPIALRSCPGDVRSCYSTFRVPSVRQEGAAGPWGKRERTVFGTLFLVIGIGALGVRVGGTVYLLFEVDSFKGLGALAGVLLMAGLSLVISGVFLIVQGVRLLQGKDLWIPGESGGDPPPLPPLPPHTSSQPSLFQLSISL